MSAHPRQDTQAGKHDRGSPRRCGDFGVDLYAPFELVTGLGQSSRGYARALQAAKVPVHFRSIHGLFSGLATMDPELAGDVRRFPLVIEHVNADTTQRFVWRFGDEVSDAWARVAVWYWELAALRPDWVKNTLRYDEIWVASLFGQRAVAAVTNVPVVVVPPPVVLLAPAGEPSRDRYGIPEDTFVFLYVFDYSSFVDRKNPMCLVDAFLDEFSGDLDVRLVLKVSHGNPTSAGYGQLLDVAQANANVVVITELLDDSSLESVFAMADCYVSPHRSEGFGLTVAEALLRACPVIATDYGSTTDFVTPDTGFPLEYSLVELSEDQGPYLRGYVWADPSREHLRQLMRGIVDDPDAARTRAEAGRRLMHERYSPEAAGERARGRLWRLHGGCARV